MELGGLRLESNVVLLLEVVERCLIGNVLTHVGMPVGNGVRLPEVALDCGGGRANEQSIERYTELEQVVMVAEWLNQRLFMGVMWLPGVTRGLAEDPSIRIIKLLFERTAQTQFVRKKKTLVKGSNGTQMVRVVQLEKSNLNSGTGKEDKGRRFYSTVSIERSNDLPLNFRKRIG